MPEFIGDDLSISPEAREQGAPVSELDSLDAAFEGVDCRTCGFGRMAAQLISDGRGVPIDQAMLEVAEICKGSKEEIEDGDMEVVEGCAFATMGVIDTVIDESLNKGMPGETQ